MLKIYVVSLMSPYVYDGKMIQRAKPKLQLQVSNNLLISSIAGIRLSMTLDHPFQRACGFAGARQHLEDSPIFRKIRAKCERTKNIFIW